MKYDPIKELNDEVERDVITPLLLIPAIFLTIMLVIAQIVKHADAIDKFAHRHWVVIGWLLVIVALSLIIRWAVKNTWR